MSAKLSQFCTPPQFDIYKLIDNSKFTQPLCYFGTLPPLKARTSYYGSPQTQTRTLILPLSPFRSMVPSPLTNDHSGIECKMGPRNEDSISFPTTVEEGDVTRTAD